MEFKYICLVVLLLCKPTMQQRTSNEVRHYPDYDYVKIGEEWILKGILYHQTTRDPLLFGDKTPLYTRLFNNYNVYYSARTIWGEADMTKRRCPSGQFVTGFHVTNPSSYYFYGIRIYKIVFTCTNFKTKESSTLDMYELLGTEGLGLTYNHETLFNESQTCPDAYLTGVRLTYHVDCCRRSHVEAWSYGMRCQDAWLLATHGYGYDNWPPVDWNHCPATTCVMCRRGWAICGANVKVTHNSYGTAEGFYFEFVCCQVKD